MTEKVILEKVNKQKISNDEMLQVSELVSTIQDQQDQVNEIEEKLKTKKEVLRRLKEEDLPNKFAEMNMSEVKMENGDKITIKPLYRGHISKTNQPSAYKWLREHDHGDLIKNEVKITFGKGEDANAAQVKEDLNNKGYSFTDREAVHPMSLSAFIREQTEKGKALPHDLLGIHIGQTTTIKRGE